MNLNSTKTAILELEKELAMVEEKLKFKRKKIIGVMVEQALCGNPVFDNLKHLFKQLNEDEALFDLMNSCLKELKDIIAKEEYRPTNRIKGLL